MAPPAPDPAAILRFADFQLDAKNGDLRRDGVPVKLPPQPFKVLVLLASRPGQLVTREEIQHQVWSDETFVDFDLGLNYCLNQIRAALGDHARSPLYIETVPKRGYRFIYPVDVGAGLKPVLGQVRDLPLQPSRPFALAAVALVATLAVVVGFNIAGLRERVLRWTGAVREPPLQIRSIAVLPLENLSGDPEQEYFADGMTDALITDLGNIGALRVISRQSVTQYKDSRKPLPQIAHELKVDAIVEGTVQRSGGRVRITTQLLDARADRHLWANAYERDLQDVLTLQGEVARAIATEVKAKITPDVGARLARARPVNPEALELYLKGTQSLERLGSQESLEYFQQAVRKDPNFARAYVGLSRSYGGLGGTALLPATEAFSKAKANAGRALELDDTLDEAHVQMASAHFNGDWDWSGAEREFMRALELNPNSDSAHSFYSACLARLARPDEAIAEARRAIEISPLLPRSCFWLGFAYYFARRYDDALVQFQKAVDMNPNAGWQTHLAWAYREKGMYKQAIAEISKVEPSTAVQIGHQGNAYARAGQKAKAQENLRKLIGLSSQGTGNYEAALICAGLGEKDQAFHWLEEAYRVHDKGMTYLKVDPPLDPLRSDPRFQDLLRRMNFPE